MATRSFPLRRWGEPLLIAMAALQLGACAGPYRLPPSAVTSVGEPARLGCGVGEIQVCRDHGTALQCTCDSY